MTILHREQPQMIHAYTRAQAIAEGTLVDAGRLAAECGFTRHVALTRAVWIGCVAWNGERESAIQDEAGRLWDVLRLGAMAARHGVGRELGASQVRYTIERIPAGGAEPTPVTLALTVGPGDDAEPVVTIGFPSED